MDNVTRRLRFSGLIRTSRSWLPLSDVVVWVLISPWHRRSFALTYGSTASLSNKVRISPGKSIGNGPNSRKAFCRIFRIGQESETYINRYVLKGTVDERLIALQERKKKLIGRALGDTEAFKHFTAEDLMRLFGTVRYDENSRPFIVVEDENNQVESAEEVEEVQEETPMTL